MLAERADQLVGGGRLAHARGAGDTDDARLDRVCPKQCGDLWQGRVPVFHEAYQAGDGPGIPGPRPLDQGIDSGGGPGGLGGGGNAGQLRTLKINASPWPPPPHKAAAPTPPPRRLSSSARVSARRAPDM